MLNFKTFNSKLLLFGEYSVIHNSMALSIPYPVFSGKLSLDHKYFDRQSNKELQSLKNYLTKTGGEKLINLQELEFDIKQGLYFDSNISQGYGLGSSGAVSAAIFDRYTILNTDDLTLEDLKKHLSYIETHFHGSSSGLDPLTSLVNTPLVLKEDKKLNKIEFLEVEPTNTALFIIDTGKSRRTEPLINLFKEKLKNEYFENFCTNELSSVTNNCINYLIEGDIENLIKSFSKLSEFQFKYFQQMIPALFSQDWEQSLNDNYYWFKLCGAGGGGFLIGLTTDYQRFSVQPIAKEIKVVKWL